jgi:hypothetical protein
VTKPKPPVGPDATCVLGTLSVGTPVSGDLGAGNSCLYPQFEDSGAAPALAQSYNFGVQAGKGYLLSVQSAYDNQASLIGTQGGVAVTRGYAWYGGDWQATVAFVAPSTTAYSVRAGQHDAVAGDTGAYVLRAQTCKVPVPMITDSITHSDNLAPGDCLMPESDFGDDSSYLHIYAIHFDSGAARTISVSASGSSVRLDMGGPGFDPYGYYDNYPGFTNSGASGVTTTETNTFVAADSGVYTLIIGTDSYSAASQPYTITVGNQQVAPLHVTPPPMTSAGHGVVGGRAKMLRTHAR